MAKPQHKILFLFPYPSETAASQRFCFEQYFEILNDTGLLYDKQAFIDERTWKILYQPEQCFQKVFGVLKGSLSRFII